MRLKFGLDLLTDGFKSRGDVLADSALSQDALFVHDQHALSKARSAEADAQSQGCGEHAQRAHSGENLTFHEFRTPFVC